jgi:hypothetical protein
LVRGPNPNGVREATGLTSTKIDEIHGFAILLHQSNLKFFQAGGESLRGGEHPQNKEGYN